MRLDDREEHDRAHNDKQRRKHIPEDPSCSSDAQSAEGIRIRVVEGQFENEPRKRPDAAREEEVETPNQFHVLSADEEEDPVDALNTNEE